MKLIEDIMRPFKFRASFILYENFILNILAVLPRLHMPVLESSWS